MGWTIGIPSLKLNNIGTKSKHCGDFRSVAEEALIERKGHDPDINPELSSQNIYEGFRTAEELLAYSDAHCSELRDAIGRSLRSDAVRMCVTIIKPPAAMMDTLTKEEQMRFLTDGVEKIREIVGANNVKSTAWHFDEQGGHVHIFWEPMTPDGRLCAKELHDLKYFGRLNREMPEYLRSKGWDIDDCNAYDAASAELMTEQERAERRQKRGRSSAVYKAAAQKELNEIELTIDWVKQQLEENVQDFVSETVEAAVSNEANVYENVLFLMVECDDERFAQLDQEGRELKRKLLQNAAEQTQVPRSLEQMIASIETRQNKPLSWKEQQLLWDRYRQVSKEFWDLRADLKAEYTVAIAMAYEKRRSAMRSYYDALYFLNRSRGIITTLIAIIMVISTSNRVRRYEEELSTLKKERQQLIQNTASFKKYSNAYREELKAGKIPFEGYLESMAKLVQALDVEASREDRVTSHNISLIRR